MTSAQAKQIVLPPGAGRIAMWLLLAALTVLFLAAMAAYAIIRVTGANSPELGALSVPHVLWGSTIVIVISSVTIQHALVCVEREKQNHFRISLGVTLLLGVIFVCLQAPGLVTILQQHEDGRGSNLHIYGLLFVLILLHAAHVLGGLIPLALAWVRSLFGRYDHEQYRPIEYIAMYWHFLDAVWVSMFVLLLVLS